MDIEVTSAPTRSPTDIVSLADQKAQMLVLNSHQDATITAAIVETVAILNGIDGALRRSILPTAYRLYLPAFPSYDPHAPERARRIELPLPPLRTVTDVQYLDADGDTQTLSDTLYAVVKSEPCGRIELIGDARWPTTKARHPRAVWVNFTAGYDPQDAIPHPTLPALRRLIKLLAAHYHENREATINEPRQMMVNRVISFGANHLIEQLRVPHDYGVI